MRQQRPAKSFVSRTDAGKLIAFGDIGVDLAAFRVTCAGQEVRMAIREYRLLCLFIRRAREVIPRQDILTNVWAPETTVRPATVDTYVLRLRKILHEAGSHVFLKTVRFQGYTLMSGRDEGLSQ